MSDKERVLQFPIESTDQLIGILEGLTELNIDLDAESTPSSIDISIYGSESDIKKASKKIYDLVDEESDR